MAEGGVSRKEVLRGMVMAAGAVAAGSLPALAQAPAAPAPAAQTPAPGADITVDDLKAFEKIAGFELTDAERKEVLAEVRSMRGQIEAARKLDVSYLDEPPTVFTTRAGGSVERAPVSFAPTVESLPDVGRMSREEIAWLSVRELSALVRKREISPVRLTDIFLDRLKRHGNELLAVVTLTEDLARAQAQRAEEELRQGKWRGPLHGIPYGLKDLFAVKGVPTTWGAAPFESQVFDYDATVVKKLEEAGAILCAKLSVGSLAMGDVWFRGTTRNPWNKAQGSSGSSAGSAASVAAGLLPFAIGTETYGSITSPSERCRVTGLRPTYGRVSRHGGMALSYTMDKVGPICRSVEDCALVLSQIVGADPLDPSAVDRPFRYPAKVDWRRLKIGYTVGPDADLKDRSRVEQDPVLRALARFGADVRPVRFTPCPPQILNVLDVESASAFDAFTRSDAIDGLKNSVWPQIFRAARYIPAVEYVQWQRLRAQMMRRFEDELGDLDAVVMPGIGIPLIMHTNLAGHPQFCLPNGDDGKGNSRAISIVGRLFQEDRLCAIAMAAQESGDFHRRRPAGF